MSLNSTRRIQRLGGSSLIVTLPKQWAKKLGLKVGDELMILEEGDHLKLIPSDNRAVIKAETVSIKYNGIAKIAGPKIISDCAYIHGYKKLIINVKGLDEATFSQLVKGLNENDKVENVTEGIDSLEVDLLSPQEEDSNKFIKELNSRLQDMVDIAMNEGNANNDLEKIRKEAEDISMTILRISKREGEQLDSISYGLIISLPNLVYSYLVSSNKEQINKNSQALKIVLSDLLGGIASNSGRRILNAVKIASEIKSTLKNEGSDGILISLLSIIESIGTKLICPAIVEESEVSNFREE
ncbi:MAG: AbrB/MazE/SpoVT family DNA-binding domain-containing protein [Caldisphaera sp.]|uniref:AbrB/MazE/SpoVT family DNA-binding domain-containing protein n=1 Tax=Caldisphaera sp. TaxID=2060322 RepID=UPI003D14A7E6